MNWKNWKLITGLVGIVLVALFFFQNWELVVVNFLFWNFSMSLSLFIIFLFAAGLLVGWSFTYFFLKKKAKSLNS